MKILGGTLLALALLVGATVRANAQVTEGNVLKTDSLSPEKLLLRGYVATLRDTLTVVESIQARITRSRASGMNSVVLSMGTQLGRRCRSSRELAQTTTREVAEMNTSSSLGNQVFASYRAALADLSTDLETCQHQDSLAMADRAPDQQRIAQVARDAVSAIDRYDAIRDAMLKLLDITLPVSGTIGRAH